MPIEFVKSHQDNTLKEFSEDKLRRFLSHICEGLSEVDQSRLYDSSVASLSDMVSTVQVYDACILAACGFMSEDPEYDTVATRVLLRKMRREVFGVSTKWGSAQAHSEYCHSFTLSIYRGVEEGRLDERLVDGRFDLDELSDTLRPERDELLKFIGLDTLYKKYVQRDSNGNVTELPQTFWMRVCMGLAILEDDPTKRAIEFYEIVSQLLSIPSTPTLLQSGTVHPQLSSCFPEGTDISTPSGVVPIEDLKKGDVVLTREGNYCKVVESKQKVTDEIVDINVRGLFTTQTTLSCTPDHLISTIKADAVGCIRQTADMACPTNQGCRARCFAKSRQYARDCDNIQKVFDSSVVAWEEAGKLSTGDYVEVSFPRGKSFSELKVIDYLPDTYTVSDGMVYKLKNDVKRNIVDELSTQTVSVNNHIPVNRDLGLFLGYFLSEGYVNDERTVAFTFNSLDTESMQQCIDAGEKLFGLTPSVLTNGDGSTRITFSSTILARFVLGVMGTGFSEKSLSPLLMEANDDFTLGYIIGVFRGDGCVTRSSSKLSLGNKNAVYQVFQLILKLGYLPTTRSVGIPKGGTTEQYEVSLNTSDALKLIQTIGKDLDRLECTTSGITSRRMWVDGRAFYRIRDISRRDVDVKVYDIEVEQDHTFTASLVSVHNCYINTVDDTLESIYKTYLDNAYLSKWSGGIGTDWTNLRATGSMVKSAGIQSQGVIPFLKIENDSTVAIARSGKRKGARVAYLETWHLDIEDFLDLRRETGDERRRTHDLHTANWIPDLFMIRVAKDEDWTLFSPDEVPDLHDAYGEDFIRLYEMYEQKAKDGLIKQFKVVKAFDLWRKMITRLSETGHPWITFKDTFNVLNPQRHRGVIHSSNLCCVSKNERVVTNKGMLTVEELYEQQTPVTVSGRGKLEQGSVMYLPRPDASMVRIHTKEGYTHTVTPDHKVWVVGKGRIEAQDLEFGDRIELQTISQFGPTDEPELAFVCGLIAGDGTFGNPVRIDLWKGKTCHLRCEVETYVHKLIERFHDGSNKTKPAKLKPEFQENDVKWSMNSSNLQKVLSQFGFNKETKHKVPDFVWKGTKKTQEEYLRGLYLTDGTTAGTNGSSVFVSLAQVNKRLLQDVQLLLLNLGVKSSLTKMRDESKRLLPDGNGGLKYFKTKQIHRLIVSSKVGCRIVEAFTSIGKDRGNSAFTDALNTHGRHFDQKFYASFTELEEMPNEDAYCLEVNSEEHVWTVNGMVSSNTEIAINTDADNCAVCNLQSLNLARVMEVPIGLRTIIHSAIRMLDNVIDLNFYPIPEAERSNKRDRPIGLGTMGLQDYLWSIGLGFEDEDTPNVVQSLYDKIQFHAVSASVELAKERGRYESFYGSRWAEGLVTPLNYHRSFIPYRDGLEVESDLPPAELEGTKWQRLSFDVSEYGMRNSLLTAIAPTASIGTIAGVLGPCIEPIYSNMFVEENLKGEFTIVNSYLINSLKKVGLWNAKTREDIKVNNGSIQSLEYIPKDIRDMYKTAFEIDQHVLIDLAAIRTPFIDQSQSLNIFYNGKSGKYLSELYQYAWKKGLKSTYYLRSERASTNEKVTVGVEHINTNKVNACRIDDPTCEACQ